MNQIINAATANPPIAKTAQLWCDSESWKSNTLTISDIYMRLVNQVEAQFLDKKVTNIQRKHQKIHNTFVQLSCQDEELTWYHQWCQYPGTVCLWVGNICWAFLMKLEGTKASGRGFFGSCSSIACDTIKNLINKSLNVLINALSIMLLLRRPKGAYKSLRTFRCLSHVLCVTRIAKQ